MESPTKTSDLPLTTKIIKQKRKTMMEDEKDVLVGEYKKSPVFAGYHIFAPTGYIERYMENVIFRFHETKKDDPITVVTNLFAKITIRRWKWKNLSLDFGSCFDRDEMLSISSHFKLFS